MRRERHAAAKLLRNGLLIIFLVYHSIDLFSQQQTFNPDTSIRTLGKRFNLYPIKDSERDSLRPLIFFKKGNENLVNASYYQAIKCYHMALQLIPEGDSLAIPIHENLGGIYYFLEDYERSIEHFQKSLILNHNKKHPDLLLTAKLLINTAAAWCGEHEFRKAAYYLNKAKEIYYETGYKDSIESARLYLNVAFLTDQQQRHQLSEEYLRKALDIYNQHSQVQAEERYMINTSLANHYFTLSKPDSAIHFFLQAISTIEKGSFLNPILVSDLYRRIGEIEKNRENWEQAMAFYKKAFHFLIGQQTEAAFIRESINSNPASIIQLFRIREEMADYYLKFGKVNHSRDSLKLAFEQFNETIRLGSYIEQSFPRDASRFLFNETSVDFYMQAIETGYELLDTDTLGIIKRELFRILEHSKNHILSEKVDRNVKFPSDGTPDSLLQREKFLNDQINLCIKNLFFKRSAFFEESEKNQFIGSLNKLINNRWELDSVLYACHQNDSFPSPALKRNPIPDLMTVQKILEPDQAIIQYFASDSILFSFLITKNDFIIKRISLPADFRDLVRQFNKALRYADLTKFYHVSGELSKYLIRPLWPGLREKKKLIIIPDDFTSLIPFDALPLPQGPYVIDKELIKPDYLIGKFEISYHFSSVLWLKSTLSPVEENQSSYGGFAPVLSSEFISGCNGTETEKAFILEMVPGKKIKLNFLPESGEEITSASDLFQRKHILTETFFSKEATESRFRITAPHFNILHIATHSLINESIPELSALVFHPGEPGGTNSTGNDGLLFMDEIYQLRLRADLLVLSACATGTGKLTRSEGVLALTRGFFAAGARNILYTLWNVPDKQTKEFMICFFRKVVEGTSYSEALRETKIEMQSNSSTSIPRFWAGYVLLGR